MSLNVIGRKIGLRCMAQSSSFDRMLCSVGRFASSASRLNSEFREESSNRGLFSSFGWGMALGVTCVGSLGALGLGAMLDSSHSTPFSKPGMSEGDQMESEGRSYQFCKDLSLRHLLKKIPLLPWSQLGLVVTCDAASLPKEDLPEYTAEEVAKHVTKDSRVWVTYKEGVYDVTEWVDLHPGGASRLMLAAGGPIDPFWAMYAQHNTEQVRSILEQYRIGNLKGGSNLNKSVIDPYKNDPSNRHSALSVRSQAPMNAETPLALLADSLITPNELFYIRNHLPVPDVDPASWRLDVNGEGMKAVQLSLNDLKTKFKKHSVVATVQCAGNRRNDLMKEPEAKTIKGLKWEGAAIGTAVWGGVLLRDVLHYAGLEDIDPNVKHIQFEGLDADLTGSTYGASIPISKALDPRGDVLLAFEMNGKPLTRDHGSPLRVIVPGVAGCRSVKWLSKIIASPEESQSFWQQNDYKSFSPSVGWDEVDWTSAPAIQNMPVTSAISEPAPGEKVSTLGGTITVKGYAWSGGGNDIIRVDVTADDGKTWHTATLKKVPQEAGRAWAWTLWEAEVPIQIDGQNDEESTKLSTKGAKEITIAAKATDESYNTQPDRADAIWNLRGVVCNAWPRVTIVIEE